MYKLLVVKCLQIEVILMKKYRHDAVLTLGEVEMLRRATYNRKGARGTGLLVLNQDEKQPFLFFASL